MLGAIPTFSAGMRAFDDSTTLDNGPRRRRRGSEKCDDYGRLATRTTWPTAAYPCRRLPDGAGLFSKDGRVFEGYRSLADEVFDGSDQFHPVGRPLGALAVRGHVACGPEHRRPRSAEVETTDAVLRYSEARRVARDDAEWWPLLPRLSGNNLLLNLVVGSLREDTLRDQFI